MLRLRLQLIERAGMIKHNWKAREADKRRPPTQLQPSVQHKQHAAPVHQPAQPTGSISYYVPPPTQVFQQAPPQKVPGRKTLRL